ncbi:MAG: hypothetical protein LC687_02315, partial [Actinobacteria bacterium]|nr:hypothetical protein [Actinomycetota bacterium]
VVINFTNNIVQEFFSDSSGGDGAPLTIGDVIQSIVNEFNPGNSGNSRVDTQKELEAALKPIDDQFGDLEVKNPRNQGGDGGSNIRDNNDIAIDIDISDLNQLILDALNGSEADLPEAVLDAKNMTDIERIGSHFSDGDLVVENLTTLDSEGDARNTDAITVVMDHTDNFDSDGDAADLKVLFDNDYLLSGQESEGKIFYFLLDEDAELAGNPNRLDNIDVDGLRFTITNADGTTTDVVLDDPAANTAGTHQGFVNALQDPLQDLIDDGTLPEGTTLVLDPTITDSTFIDDGSRSDDIPAMVLTSGDGSEVEATGFSRIEQPIGEYDVYGRFNSEFGIEDEPISVNIELDKVGRGAEGGDLIVGGKSENTSDGIAAGIEEFNIAVKGPGRDDPSDPVARPNSLGTITSTGSALGVINIATHEAFAGGDTFASLEVRNGFNAVGESGESGDLREVNADTFLGDLLLGTNERIVNLDTLTAQGGGDVTLRALLDGDNAPKAYSYTTGEGDDTVDVLMDGDALDYAGSSVNVSTGAGDDNINLAFAPADETGPQSEQLNQTILDGVTVEGGSGDDNITVNGVGNANINGGDGDDVIITAGAPVNALSGNDDGVVSSTAGNPATNAVWAFNFDAESADQAGGIGSFAADELPGEQTSLA